MFRFCLLLLPFVFIGSDAVAQVFSWRKVVSVENTLFVNADCADASSCALVLNTGLYQAIWRSFDGGLTWSACYRDDDHDTIRSPLPLGRVQHPTPALILVCADSGVVLRSTDAGGSWNRVQVAGAGNRVRFLSMADGLRGIAVCDGQGVPVSITSDGGATWSRIQISRPPGWDTLWQFPSDIRYLGGGVIIAAIDGPRHTMAIARSTDSGSTWNVAWPVVPGEESWSFTGRRISAYDNLHVAIGGVLQSTTQFALLSSTDGGASWQRRYQQTGIPLEAQFMAFRDSLNGLAAGTGGAAVTTDGGNTWTLQDTSLTWMSDLVYKSCHPGLLLSRTSGAVYLHETTTGAERGTTSDAPVVFSSGTDGLCRVTYALPRPTSTHVRVFDLKGCVVWRRDAQIVRNSQEVLDLRGLNRGPYLVVVSMGNQVRAFKHLLQR